MGTSNNTLGLSNGAYGGILGGLFGGSGAASGAFGGTSTTNSNQSGSGTNNQQYSQSGSSTPTYDASTDFLRKTLNNTVLQNLQNSTDLSGYQSSGIEGINQNADAQKIGLNQSLAGRGLTYSPVAATSGAQVDANRGNQINSFNNTIPLIQQQLYEQKLADAQNQFKANPFGTSQTGQGSSAGQQTQQSSGTSTTKTTPAGGILGGILGGLSQAASLFAA